jgi:hypothetical protein
MKGNENGAGRRWVKKIALGFVIVLVVAQLVPLKRDNPETDPSKTIFAQETVPPSLRTVFERSCEDCHSNHTVWPWYSYVAPASWIVAHDVHEARRHMNFSVWGDYSAKQKEEKLEDLCDEVSQGDMPDTKYLLIHRGARLKQSEREAICRWTDAVRQY